jgi:hypothetical protein
MYKARIGMVYISLDKIMENDGENNDGEDDDEEEDDED